MKKFLPLLVIPPLVVLLDQATKYWIVQHILVGSKITVWAGFFDLVHLKNPGAAFSMLADWDSELRNKFFLGVSSVALLALIILYVRTKAEERRVQIPLALILGGAIGNLVDRLNIGEVTDFLYFHWQDKWADFTLAGKHFHFAWSWPAFNVADSAITCGALFLVGLVLFGSAEHAEAKKG